MVRGFIISITLVMVMGAQNVFVFRQGIRRQHVFVVAALCFLIDTSLIASGVHGFGALIDRYPLFIWGAKWAGAFFLLFFGYWSFHSALQERKIQSEESSPFPGSEKIIVMATLGISLLNPNVYLDTVILVGGVGSLYTGIDRTFFIIGATFASFIWFFSLAYGGRLLTPFFRNPKAWQVLDIFVGMIMWVMALTIFRI